MVVMDGDLLDIVCPRPVSSSSAFGDAVAPPSACCDGQAAIPPAVPPAKKVSAADVRLCNGRRCLMMLLVAHKT